MITLKLKLWRTASAAAVVGLAACGGEAGEGSRSHGEGGESGEGSASAPAPSAATAVAPAGGEQGEAGAASAYVGLTGDQVVALRLQHLKGFILAAETVAAAGHPDEAAMLVQQGILEVHTPAPDQFGNLDISVVAAVGEPGGGDLASRLRAAEGAVDAASSDLNVDHAVLAARMVDIATVLYRGVVQEDFVDAIEYQHSHGAALAAKEALAAGASELRRRDARAYRDAQAELERFSELWPTPEAPEHPAPYGEVLAQGSRVRLALSPYL